jgi:hypothetical protein
MRSAFVRLLLAGLVLALASAPALAQGTTKSSLAGLVVDGGGGAVPGATRSGRCSASTRIWHRPWRTARGTRCGI